MGTRRRKTSGSGGIVQGSGGLWKAGDKNVKGSEGEDLTSVPDDSDIAPSGQGYIPMDSLGRM